MVLTVAVGSDRPGDHEADGNREQTVQEGAIVMTKLFSRFVKDESGATAIEYGLIAALIALVVITAATTVGTNLGIIFNQIAGNLQ